MQGGDPLANPPDAAAFRSAASRRYQETNKISVIDVFNKLFVFLILDDFSKSNPNLNRIIQSLEMAREFLF